MKITKDKNQAYAQANIGDYVVYKITGLFDVKVEWAYARSNELKDLLRQDWQVWLRKADHSQDYL